MSITEIQTLLTGLMRSIDKKTALTVEPRVDPNQANVKVHLSRGKRTGSLQFAEVDLLAAQTDLMRRNQVRSALKRARDRMWESEAGYIFSTKLEPHKVEATHWARPSQGGRGRR